MPTDKPPRTLREHPITLDLDHQEATITGPFDPDRPELDGAIIAGLVRVIPLEAFPLDGLVIEAESPAGVIVTIYYYQAQEVAVFLAPGRWPRLLTGAGLQRLIAMYEGGGGEVLQPIPPRA